MSRPGPRRAPSTPRLAAAAALAAVGGGTKLDAALDRFIRGRLDRRAGSFAEGLVKNVLRHRRLLDYRISRVVDHPLEKTPPPVRDILRLGGVELFFMKTPAYAAVNEAVAAVKASPFAGLAPFVNAALRALASGEEASFPAGGEVSEYLAVAYSHPDWLVRRWVARLGAAEAEELMAAHNAFAPLNVYPNPTKVDRPGLAEILQGAGCGVTEGPFDSLTVALGERRLPELEAFREGLFLVIDPASSLGPRRLAPPRGATVADLCAGAGGKTAQLAWAVGPNGTVVAVDASARKLEACASAAERLGLANVEIRRGDILREALPAADFYFLDPPCTNLGVIRRKPDVKWRVQEEDVAAAASTQEAMLARVVAGAPAGAAIVYNVCSLEPEENEEVVTRVVTRSPVTEEARSAEEFGDACDGRFLRTWPHRHGCNGGFVAKLRRAK